MSTGIHTYSGYHRQSRFMLVEIIIWVCDITSSLFQDWDKWSYIMLIYIKAREGKRAADFPWFCVILNTVKPLLFPLASNEN